MKAGALRHSVDVLQPTSVYTAKGDVINTYSKANDDEEMCLIEPLQGRELLFAKQLAANLSHKIVMRYREDITNVTILRWFYDDDLTKFRLFLMGPPVESELRGFMASFYAVEQIGNLPRIIEAPLIATAAIADNAVSGTLTFTRECYGTTGFYLTADGVDITMDTIQDGATYTFQCSEILPGQMVLLRYIPGNVLALEDNRPLQPFNNVRVSTELVPV